MMAADVFHNIYWKYWKETLNNDAPEKHIKKDILFNIFYTFIKI